MFIISRRAFLKLLSALGVASFMFPENLFAGYPKPLNRMNNKGRKNNSGISPDAFSHIYVSRNGSPGENMAKVIEMMGGIEKFIGPTDIVILKPNAQWWNQGTTNTNSMQVFIEMVLKIPAFEGEVIIGENHHFPDDNSRGWTTELRNGDYNLNELVEYFQKLGHRNVTKVHWHDGGPSKPNMHGGAKNGGIVKGPWEGDGYCWCEDSVYQSKSGKKTMMNYPIFTSTYSKLRIDLKNGVWKDGKYLSIPVKLINFSSVNHHGSWAGVTASIKNYLGIVDLACGYRGLKPKGFFNFHYMSDKTSRPWRLRYLLKRLGIGYIAHFSGGPVGYFMRTVRMADLNIVTAHWVGWGSRTDPKSSAYPRTVLASADPVALDYYAAKYVLLPSTPKSARNKEDNYYYHEFNDPDRSNRPFRWQLEECHLQGIGTLDPDRMKVYEYDFAQHA